MTVAGHAALAADVVARTTQPTESNVTPRIDWPKPNLDVLAGGFGFSFGSRFASENIWRGISVTAHRPSAVIYGEANKGWLYLGGLVTNITLPSSPAVRIDVYGGIRPTWGPLTLDFGAVYHSNLGNMHQWFIGGAFPVLNTWTPGAIPTTPFDESFVEIYGRPSWAINDYLTIGADFSYSPNWANYNAQGLYSGGTATLSLPGTGVSLSGAFGHYYLGMGSPAFGPTYIQPGITGIQGFKLASYNTWNVGLSYKWKNILLDVRYHDNTLTKTGCFINFANPAGNWSAALFGQGVSDWCQARVVGSIQLNFDSSMLLHPNAFASSN